MKEMSNAIKYPGSQSGVADEEEERHEPEETRIGERSFMWMKCISSVGGDDGGEEGVVQTRIRGGDE